MFDAPAIDTTQAAEHRLASHKPAVPRGYLALWACLTCVASVYIVQVSLESIDMPRLLARNGTESGPTADPARGLQAELATLRHNLSDFQRDLGRVRADLETRKQDASVVASLSAIEERMSMMTGIALAKSAPAAETGASTTAAVQAPAGPAAPAQPATDTAKVAAIGEGGLRQLEVRTISIVPPSLEKMMTPPIETGSIPAAAGAAGKMSGQLPKAAAGTAQAPAVPAIANPATTAALPVAPAVVAVAPAVTPAATPAAFGPAVVKPEPKPYAVQLGSGASLDDIRYNWSILSGQHADALAKLTPRFTSTGTPAAGQTYDLIAGPVKTAADAKKICKVLATRGMDCRVAPYEGEAF